MFYLSPARARAPAFGEKLSFAVREARIKRQPRSSCLPARGASVKASSASCGYLGRGFDAWERFEKMFVELPGKWTFIGEIIKSTRCCFRQKLNLSLELVTLDERAFNLFIIVLHLENFTLQQQKNDLPFFM